MNKKYIIPPSLKKGDQAIIISPSGNIDSEYIAGAKSVLISWGLKVKLGTFSEGGVGRFGGTVEERLSDLQSAMDDKDIKLILCSRGGYGVVHLLDKLKFSKIRKHPKWIVGYSDITALHLALLRNGIVSLHAPMARHLTENCLNEASCYLKEVLFTTDRKYSVPPNKLNCLGKVSGRLFGGNLTVMGGLIGTKYMNIPPQGILFIEDIGEYPYKIDRMMWQLKLSGVLKKLSGLIVGQFTDCKEDPLMGMSIYEGIRSIVSEYGYPVVFDFPVGHVDDNYPLIHGGMVNLNVEEKGVILDLKT